MTIRRTLTSNRQNLSFRLEYGDIKVVAGLTDGVVVELSTDGDETSETAKAINKATITERGDYAAVVVPDLPSSGGFSVGGITVTRGGGIQVNSFSGMGNVSVINGRVFIDGREVTPDGKNPGKITAILRVPNMADVRIDSVGAGASHEGGSLGRVEFYSTSGDMNINQCVDLQGNTTSGDVSANVTVSADFRSTSGDLRVGQARKVNASTVSGDVTVSHLEGDAHVSSTSGDIRVRAQGPGDIDARTVSGDITVADPHGLYRQGQLTVRTSTVSGDIESPDRPQKNRPHW